MKITLPLPPNRANARWHWRTEQRKRTDYELRCRVFSTMEPGQDEPDMPWERARIKATLYVWSRNDLDNLMARMKWPVDWLVKAGYLVDDSPDHLEWVGLPEQHIDRRNQRIEIELEAA